MDLMDIQGGAGLAQIAPPLVGRPLVTQAVARGSESFSYPGRGSGGKASLRDSRARLLLNKVECKCN